MSLPELKAMRDRAEKAKLTVEATVDEKYWSEYYGYVVASDCIRLVQALEKCIEQRDEAIDKLAAYYGGGNAEIEFILEGRAT